MEIEIMKVGLVGRDVAPECPVCHNKLYMRIPRDVIGGTEKCSDCGTIFKWQDRETGRFIHYKNYTYDY